MNFNRPERIKSFKTKNKKLRYLLLKFGHNNQQYSVPIIIDLSLSS